MSCEKHKGSKNKCTITEMKVQFTEKKVLHFKESIVLHFKVSIIK